MSKSTIISMIPFDIHEQKPLYPGDFFIPAAKDNDIEVLVVGDSVSFSYIDEHRGTIKVPVSSEEIAKSVVNDYENSQLARTAENGPGVFWVSGEHTKQEIKLKFRDEVKLHRDRQIRWFTSLVKAADDTWEKTRQHKTISDIERYAARFLNLDRSWLIAPQMTKCIACKTTVEEDAIICPNCRAVLNKESYEKLQFAKV